MQRAQYGVSDNDGGVVQKYGQQLAEIHANALPGVTRLEEGEERSSPVGDLERGLTAQEALHMSYDEIERARERQRYEEYLDEQDSEKLPNAFDLGWKRNLLHLFGESPLFWLLPICNTQGDGWHWDPSPKWLEAREEVRRHREMQWKEQEERETQAGWGRGRAQVAPQHPRDGSGRQFLNTSSGVIAVSSAGSRSPGKADRVLGRTPNQYADGNFEEHTRPSSGMSMRTLRRKTSFDRVGDEVDHYEVSTDEDDYLQGKNSDSRHTSRQADASNGRAEDEWREWD
ncbi:palmitoyltransferase for Vac8p [Xylographa trunciseda]|nr:palmitoyltransferase for Vac8p [Xylographa trunciseda]